MFVEIFVKYLGHCMNLKPSPKLDWASISSTYTDAQNQERTLYELDKELTFTLTSGYSIVQRNAIVKRWLELESNVQPLSPTELIIQSAQALLAVEQQQQQQQKQLDRQDQKIQAVEEKLEEFNGETGYRTITAWCSLRKYSMPLRSAQRFGKACAKYCRKNGIEVGAVADERWNSVKSYPIEVLDYIYQQDW